MTLLLALLLGALQGTGAIDGVVVRAGTDPPVALANARVELSRGDQSLVVRTDDAGRFTFAGLGPGAYAISVTRDGYVRQGTLQDAGPGASPGISLVLDYGQRIENVVIELQPAPTISGRIEGLSRKPLTDVVVQALRVTFDALGTRHLTVFASTRTDDRGQYRLYWLDPGEYFIQTLAPPPDQPEAARMAYAPTYFPGFPEIDNARPVRSEVGRETSGIDFTMTRQSITQVTGRVVHALTRQPIAAKVRLAPAMTPGAHLYEATSDPDGTFLFSGVAPGSYITSAVATAGQQLTATTRVQVRDFDPRLVMEVGPGIALEGQIFSSQMPAIPVEDTLVNLIPLDPFLPAVAARADQEGRLKWNGIQPGAYVMDLANMPQDLYLTDARFGAEDPMSKPLEFGYTELAYPQLQLLLNADGGSLRGRVSSEDGKPLAGAVVSLVPFENQGHQIHRYRTTTSDANGDFVLRGIPPGEFDLYAWGTVQPRAWLNTDFLRLYEHLSLRVVVRPGENEPVAIGVIQP